MYFFLFMITGKFSSEENDTKVSKSGIFKSLNSAICLCLSQLGDNSLVLKLLFKHISREMVYLVI